MRNEKLEMRNGGAAHKHIEAPQSIDDGDARRWYLVTSHQSPVKRDFLPPAAHPCFPPSFLYQIYLYHTIKKEGKF